MVVEKFGEGYFVGKEGSNYVDYRQRRYDGLAEDLVNVLPIRSIDRVVDLGTATGALMYALKKKGIQEIKGTDISLWAVQFGRENFGFTYKELQYYNLNLLCEPKEWLIALDVFEHCPPGELERVLEVIGRHPPLNGLVVRIPVSLNEGEDFALDVSKNDRTHVQIHSKTVWKNIFKQYGFEEKVLLNTKHIYDSEGVYCAVFKHVDKNAEVCIHCRVVHGSGPVCEAA